MQSTTKTVTAILVGAILVASISLNAVLFATRPQSKQADTPHTSPVTSQIDSARFQAVFLTNGQVYFGRLSLVDSANYKLTNVYYQNPAGDGIVKLGAESHRPEDAMVIPATQVLFFENLQRAGQFNGALQ